MKRPPKLYEVRKVATYQMSGSLASLRNVKRVSYCIVYWEEGDSIGRYEMNGPSGRPLRFRSREAAEKRVVELRKKEKKA